MQNGLARRNSPFVILTLIMFVVAGCSASNTKNSKITEQNVAQRNIDVLAKNAKTDHYRKGCDAGDLSGCYKLGYVLYTGNGARPDINQAIMLFEKSCDGDYADGCILLAFQFEKGFGVERDRLRAKKLQEKACDLGSAHGCNNLGSIYYYGLGVELDFKQAKAFYEKACSISDSGCYNLAEMFYEGKGVTKDFERAKALHRMGCDDGVSPSCERLKEIEN